MHGFASPLSAGMWEGSGWPVLRFNFRRTGLRQGGHDGTAEVEGVLAALDWLDREYHQPPVVGGFSFRSARALWAGCEPEVIDLAQYKRIFVIAIGKAAPPILEILLNRIKRRKGLRGLSLEAAMPANKVEARARGNQAHCRVGSMLEEFRTRRSGASPRQSKTHRWKRRTRDGQSLLSTELWQPECP